MLVYHASSFCLYWSLLLSLPTLFLGADTGIGLLYVAASVWQMLRGSIILFTGTFSVSGFSNLPSYPQVVFLKKKLRPSQWIAMLIIVVCTFSRCSSISQSVFDILIARVDLHVWVWRPCSATAAPSPATRLSWVCEPTSLPLLILGIVLVLAAQVISATQMVSASI